MQRQSTTPQIRDAKRLRIATDAAGIALWSWNVDSDEIELDEKSHVMWGVPVENGLITFEGLSARIHPQDLDRIEPRSPQPATSSADTKSTSEFCTAAKYDGYRHVAEERIRVSSIGSCLASS